VRRIVAGTTWPRRECLRRAREYDWLAEHSLTAEGAAYGFDQARLWRSLALVASPKEAPVEDEPAWRSPVDLKEKG
jgi:hypothetical protein